MIFTTSELYRALRQVRTDLPAEIMGMDSEGHELGGASVQLHLESGELVRVELSEEERLAWWTALSPKGPR